MAKHIYVLGSRYQSTIRCNIYYTDDEKAERITASGRNEHLAIITWEIGTFKIQFAHKSKPNVCCCLGGTMNIKETPELLLATNQLRNIFHQFKTQDSLLNRIPEEIHSIKEWVYSTADNLDPQPYLNEINGRKPGRILKKTYSDPFEAKLDGYYSHGFEKSILKLTIHPSEIKSVIPITYFLHDEKFKLHLNIEYLIKDEQTKKTTLQGLVGCFQNQSDSVFINVSDLDEYLITAYKYSDKKIKEVLLWGNTWTNQGVRNFNYDKNGELINITSPSKDGTERIIWKK